MANARSIALQGQTTIVLALVVGGITLAALGVLRLRSVGFVAMPRQVAIASVLGGALVVAFAGALLVAQPTSEPEAAPRAPIATLAPAAEGEGPDTGIAGRVSLPRGRPASAQVVHLVPMFTADGVKTEKTETDERGRFVFPDVEVNPGSPYAIEVKYEGVVFTSPILRLPVDDLVINIAPPTKKADEIRVVNESLAMVGDSEGLQAVHAITLRNDDNKAYTGGLRLPLLPGAASIQEGPGLDRRRLELAGGEMISTAPILPGEHDYTYTYVAPMAKDGVAFERKMSLRTGRYELLVGGSLVATNVDGLKPSSDVELGTGEAEKRYVRYLATQIGSGDEISARVGVKAAPSPLRFGIPIALLLLAIAFVLLPMLRRKRRREPEIVEAETQPV